MLCERGHFWHGSKLLNHYSNQLENSGMTFTLSDNKIENENGLTGYEDGDFKKFEITIPGKSTMMFTFTNSNSHIHDYLDVRGYLND